MKTYASPYHKYSFAQLKFAQSKSVNSSQHSLSKNGFAFDKPLNIIWKSKPSKRTASSGNVSELSDTCMFNEGMKNNNFELVCAESQTDISEIDCQSPNPDNYDLVNEVKNLRNEVNELKAIVRELQLFKIQTQISNNQQVIFNLEKENETIKKTLKPPLPVHRPTKSNSFL